MLVLTRKQNEKIRIGDQITITVLRMKGKAVRLGIEAPPEVSVLRGELAFEIEENAAAVDAAVEEPAAKSAAGTRGGVVSGPKARDRWSGEQETTCLLSEPLTQLQAGHGVWEV